MTSSGHNSGFKVYMYTTEGNTMVGGQIPTTTNSIQGFMLVATRIGKSIASMRGK